MSTIMPSAPLKQTTQPILPAGIAGSGDIWVKRLLPNPKAGLRLFCFPYAGGAASIFRQWPETISSQIEVCPVQLPGRENRMGEPLVTRLDQPYMDRPFAFYGHSMGTLIVFELARALRRQQMPGPVHLIVSGRCAPQVPDPAPQLHKLSDTDFINGLRRYNGTREEVLNNTQLMELLVPLLRADFEMCETYQCADELPLDCPITAYAGTEEPCHTMIDDWATQTTRNFDSQLIPGGHFFLNTEKQRFVTAISDRLLTTIGK